MSLRQAMRRRPYTSSQQMNRVHEQFGGCVCLYQLAVPGVIAESTGSIRGGK